MNVIDLHKYLQEVDRLNQPTKDKLMMQLKAKIKRVNTIKENGHEMTQKQWNFVKAESEFVDTLIYFLQLEQQKVAKIMEIVTDFTDSYVQEIYNGAQTREKIQMQQEFIADLQKQNKNLIEILHERFKRTT